MLDIVSLEVLLVIGETVLQDAGVRKGSNEPARSGTVTLPEASDIAQAMPPGGNGRSGW